MWFDEFNTPIGSLHVACDDSGLRFVMFENNKYDVTEPELSTLLKTKEAQEVSACIKSRLAQGAKLHHVSIVSSSSHSGHGS